MHVLVLSQKAIHLKNRIDMRLFFTITLLWLGIGVSAQEAQLAQQYYLNGEYEKAAALYKKLYDQQPHQEFYFDRYVQALIAVGEYDEPEKAIRKELKRHPDRVKLYVTLGYLKEQQYELEEAEKYYAEALRKMPADQFGITRVASAFTSLRKYDYAIEAYERGSELLKDPYIFSYNLAELYRRMGNTEKMVEHYLNSLAMNPARLGNIQALLERNLQGEEDYAELQRQLYQRIQQDKDAIQFVELLSWLFIQKGDYRNALRQARALDRRLDENGSRVYRLGRIAAMDGAWDAAIAAFDYIVEEKGPTSTFYIDAKREALRARREKLVRGYAWEEADLRELEAAYETFLDEFGRNTATAELMLELADLEANYLHDLPKAIDILKQVVELPGLKPQLLGEAKLRLGDLYLMTGDVWEATLLYSQVDKAFKEDRLGHEARLRNARLSYYIGDFEWAQAQCKVLKASTSKLIANDALDLSIFIMDNLGLDTTAESLQLYAQAELLTFQNRFDEAFAKLDTLLQKFPGHSLEDDVLYAKAHIYTKLRRYDEAIAAYEQIIEKHPDEIRADNALYELAQLYDNVLQQPEKAMELYEKLFLDYSNSILAVEARKRYRQLRGDAI